ncbi:hypothetical protein U2075_14730, partial [Listeria monocytogenes]|uniref:hypothetical protein n=1 Tax=Listeria monocytogenes TaxID=1639 RepID=UPI002FDC4307
APEGREDGRVSMLLRLSIPGGTAPQEIAEYHATLPDPVYGTQLQDLATPGHIAQGRIVIDYKDLPVTLADGTIVTLRAPAYALGSPAYG